MKDLAIIEQNILALPHDATPEQLLELQDRVTFAKQFVKELDKLIEDRLIEHIEANGPIECGTMRYVATVDKSYKAKGTPAEMTEKMMNLHAGDYGKVVSYLASNCYKHGQLRKDLDEMKKPELFDEFFETVIRKSVEGKPVKKLAALDSRFV